MCACDVGSFINEVYVYSKPSSEREWGWGNGLSNPWQMSPFCSKEWPWEFAFGQTRFCSKAGLFFSVRSGRRFACACSQPGLRGLPASLPPAQPASPGPGRSGEHGQAEPLGLWDRKAGSSVGISPTALRGRRGDPGRGSRPGLSGFGKVWEVLQPPPLLPASSRRQLRTEGLCRPSCPPPG